MKRMIVGLLTVGLAAALVFEWTRLAPGCMPPPAPTVFTGTDHPDSPLGPYTRGRLGVLEPDYQRVHLYVAYRNLMGRSFDRAQALALWGFPPDSPELLDQPPKPGPAPPLISPPPQPPDWPHAWIDARNQVPNVAHAEYLMPWPGMRPSPNFRLPTPDGINRYAHGPGDRLAVYVNCLPPAFESAIDTLQDRTREYGAGSTQLAAWITAQDEVFSNCAQGDNVPAPLEANASPLARADRDYQIASAYFYAGDFAKAVTAFQAIAADRTSPWSPLAQYLVARAYIREATVGHDDDSPDMAALANAESQLKQALDNPKSPDLHASAAALLDYVEVRLHPDQKVRELAQVLMQNPTPAELAREVHDYTFLLDRLESERYSQSPAELQASRGEFYPKLAELRGQDDLTDWILTFQLNDAAARDHGFEKWQQTNSTAWLVAAITKMDPSDPRAAKLIEATQTVQASAPAYASVTFHRFRLMMQGGERAAVLPQLNRLLARDTATMPRSALNLFLAMRMTYARNLAEFLKYAARVPVETSYYGYWPSNAAAHPPEGSPWFDSDALMVLNQQMTPATLTEVAENNALPVYLRREVARGAWTRAFLLGDDQAALKLAPVLASLQPELRASLNGFSSAATPGERRFAGTLTILRFPGLRPYISSPERDTPTERIDNFRENWWGDGLYCGWPAWQFDSGVSQQPGAKPNIVPWPVLEPPLTELYPAGTVPPPSFMTRTEIADAQRDWTRTRALPVASIVLGNDVLAWARQHPDDSRAPEALALAVRAGHFGCADPDRWKVSKAAFDLLHRQYPASSWAKQAKFWYR